MNPELYTDEFRDFKYLKSSYEAVQFYKNSADQINKVQSWNDSIDPSFHWPTRIEFFEQILDLRQDTIYLVDPGQLNSSASGYGYEESRILEIEFPFLYCGNLFKPEEGRPAGIEDIPDIESSLPMQEYFLCSGDYITHKITGHVLSMYSLPIYPSNFISLSAMFYDKEWAKRYCQSLTTFLRKNIDAISTISRIF